MRLPLSKLAIGGLLALATVAAYYQVVRHDFAGMDDFTYVANNPMVREGLSWQGVRWAITSFHACNWHPITWLSHMLDCELFGMNPGRHHGTNLFFHVANTLLLFLVLERATKARWPSVSVAALFALHPLHVESVAWIAERKDVLSAFFWMLTLWTWLRWVERARWRWYVLALLFFALGLMAKPMLVTLPFVLLLLDHWPLRRLELPGGLGRREPPAGPDRRSRGMVPLGRLVVEKVPFLLLSAGSSVVTYIAQKTGGATVTLQSLSLGTRLTNALVAYLDYLLKMVWPVNLAVLYPHPQEAIPVWKVGVAALVLASITAVAVWQARRRPYLPVAWFWYAGTLVPVAGIVQVGVQAMADRYTYLPLIGAFVMVAWSGAEIGSRRRGAGTALAVGTGVALLALAVGTWRQVGYWTNSVSLFQHTVRVTRDNPQALYNLGVALAQQGRDDEALERFSEAVRIWPDYGEAHHNLGIALLRKGRNDEALHHLAEARRLLPAEPTVAFNFGRALRRQGYPAEALRHLREAARLSPGRPEPLVEIAKILSTDGDRKVRDGAEAVRVAEEALRLAAVERPDLLDTLAAAYAEAGRYPEAVRAAERALTLARRAGRQGLADRIERRLGLYRQGLPYRE